MNAKENTERKTTMNQIVKIDDESDAAEIAFQAIHRELAMVRRAVEHFVTERADIEIPDYSITLGEMKSEIAALTEEIEILSEQPALGFTPERFAHNIRAAGAKAREDEHAMFSQSTETFVALGRELAGLLKSAHTAEDQIKVQRIWGAGGLIIGVIVTVILPGAIAHALPASWAWPEHMAANILYRDEASAGARLMEVANPQEWKEISDTMRATKNSRAAVADCIRAATKRNEPVRCTITVNPDN
jgi:hypothetical protein